MTPDERAYFALAKAGYSHLREPQLFAAVTEAIRAAEAETRAADREAWGAAMAREGVARKRDHQPS